MQNVEDLQKKRYSLNFVILLCLIGLTTSCASQQKIIKPFCVDKAFDPTVNNVSVNNLSEYPNPETISLCPIEISKGEADRQEQIADDSLGFTRVYFPKAQLRKLLHGNKTTGIVFMMGKNPNVPGVPFKSSLVAIGVKKDRNQRHTPIFRNFKYSNVVNGKLQSNKTQNLNLKYAKEYVKNAYDDPNLSDVGVFFSKNIIDSLLNIDGAKGVHLIPGILTFDTGNKTVLKPTLIITAAKIKDKTTIDFVYQDRKSAIPYNRLSSLSSLLFEFQPLPTSPYFESKMPCPPDCKPRTDRLIPE